MNRFDPGEAYWNQRLTLFEARNRILALSRAIEHPSDLWPYQFTQVMAAALEFRPDLILELGRGYGNSTCAFVESANRLAAPECEVVSVCLSDSWEANTLPRLRQIVPPSWFEPLRVEHGSILEFDFGRVLRPKNRVLVFWDAHGFEIAEVVLGRILPAIVSKANLILMHDLSDTRYGGPESLQYGDVPLWKGGNAGGPRVCLGTVNSAVEQSVAVLDFTTRNKLTLHSGDHSLHTRFDSGPEGDTMRCLLGPELFSTQAHWFWFSLNEHEGPYTFPRMAVKR